MDPIIKVLHRPSIERWLVRGEQYLQYPEGHPSVQALERSICYAAVITLTEDQCRQMLQASKSSVVDEACKACEAAFHGAVLLSTQDITVLQAFVLFLVSPRQPCPLAELH